MKLVRHWLALRQAQYLAAKTNDEKLMIADVWFKEEAPYVLEEIDKAIERDE